MRSARYSQSNSCFSFSFPLTSGIVLFSPPDPVLSFPRYCCCLLQLLLPLLLLTPANFLISGPEVAVDAVMVFALVFAAVALISSRLVTEALAVAGGAVAADSDVTVEWLKSLTVLTELVRMTGTRN